VRNEKLTGLLLIMPAFIYLMFFLIVYPFGYNLYQSLFEFSMLTGVSKFVFFNNFIGLLRNPQFLNSLKISGIIAFLALAIETVLGLLIAMALNRQFKGRTLARILLILPLGTIPVINGYIFSLLFFPEASVVDHMLNMLGIINGHIPWLREPGLARFVVVLMDVWQWTPFMVLILMAGLSAIPESYYELARLDDMSSWKIFWRITLPKLKFPLTLAMLIRSMDLLKFFDGVFSMTKGGPQSATETASYYIYRTGFSTFNIGFASAASVTLWAIIWIIAFVVIGKVFLSKEAKV